jgi:hypothetical protein
MPALLNKEMEFEGLFVAAGFGPLEAIKIATSNGARYLGRLEELGPDCVSRVAGRGDGPSPSRLAQATIIPSSLAPRVSA